MSSPKMTFYNKKNSVLQFVCEIGRMMKKKRDNISATNLRADGLKQSSDSQKKKSNYSYQLTAKLTLTTPDTNVGTVPLGCIWQLD